MMEYQNPIVAKLMGEFVRVGKKAPNLSRISCSIAHTLVDDNLSTFQDHKRDAAERLDQSVSSYWMKYVHLGKKDIDENSRDENEQLYVFPGRDLIRPPMRTDVKDKPGCTKKYHTSRQDMSSFISLQCPCKHPKIVGFALIKEVESIAMAISTVLAYLKFPPRTLWYENSCNLYDSALIRTPFLLRSCLLVVDRLHF